jgi:hypothetical protein
VATGVPITIIRSKALSSAVGWFAIAWAILDGILYVARILLDPRDDNAATGDRRQE